MGRHRELLGRWSADSDPSTRSGSSTSWGWATWYYTGESYPVLQAVYPDLENRFTADPGFDERFAQPLMQPDAPTTQVKQNFWASANP